MPEKKDQETQRHAWPPVAVTCYMPTYCVLKEQEAGRDIFTLVRVASGKPDFMIRTRKYADLLETVIQDATIPVFSVTPRQLIEASFGEPRWKYGSGDDEYKYEFAKRPDYFLKPDFEEREDYEPKPEEPKAQDESKASEATPPDARVCPKHNVPKLRNGCRLCRREGPAGTMFEPVCPHHGQKYKSGMKGNPPRQSYKCAGCRRENTTRSPQPAGDVQPPNCPKHGVAKVKDGHKRGGQRRWRCLVCNPRVRAEAGAGGSSPKGGSTRGLTAYHASKLKDNPKCETCGQRLRKGKTYKDSEGKERRYWKCVNKCVVTGHESERKFNQLSVEELLPIVDKVVRRMNGHDPQDRADINQAIALDLHRGILKPAELYDRDRMRRYIEEQNRFSIDGRRTLDLDAPVGNGDSKMTYAEAKPAPAAECDPHQQLEAKEAVEARLRGQPAAPLEEFTAPLIEDAHDFDGSEE